MTGSTHGLGGLNSVPETELSLWKLSLSVFPISNSGMLQKQPNSEANLCVNHRGYLSTGKQIAGKYL